MERERKRERMKGRKIEMYALSSLNIYGNFYEGNLKKVSKLVHTCITVVSPWCIWVLEWSNEIWPGSWKLWKIGFYHGKSWSSTISQYLYMSSRLFMNLLKYLAVYNLYYCVKQNFWKFVIRVHHSFRHVKYIQYYNYFIVERDLLDKMSFFWFWHHCGIVYHNDFFLQSPVPQRPPPRHPPLVKCVITLCTLIRR